MQKVKIAIVLWAATFVSAMHPAALAEQSKRPEGLTLEAFQFGPVNRWTFSHMREVLPTINIGRDTGRFLPLEQSARSVSDFSVSFQDSVQAIDEIAGHQYIDGLLVIREGQPGRANVVNRRRWS